MMIRYTRNGREPSRRKIKWQTRDATRRAMIAKATTKWLLIVVKLLQHTKCAQATVYQYYFAAAQAAVEE